MVGSRNIIFVGGIHGVGKSTTCKKLCRDLGLEYLSASELIGVYSNKLRLRTVDNGKLVADIDKNQDVLVEAVKAHILQDEYYLLDGHFTLFDAMRNIQVIPVSTFAALLLTATIVLTDDPASIQKKLLMRDGKQYDLKLLETMQTQELEHARYVCHQLGIKVFEVSVGASGDLKQIVADSFGEKHIL